MERYTAPEMKIIGFESEDIITTSVILDDDELPVK